MGWNPAIRDVDAVGEITQASYVPVDKGIMKNKNYRADVRSILESCCKVTKKQDGSYIRTITDKKLRKIMRRAFGMRKVNVDKTIAAYLNEGVLSFYGNEEYTINFVKPFAHLDPGTLKYCLINLSSVEFKVYCYLKMMHDAQKSVRKKGCSKVSVSGKNGLLALCGYANSGSANRKMMNGVLENLRDKNLVKITDPYPFRDKEGQYRGWYRNVLEVNDMTATFAKEELVPWKEEFRQDSTDEYYFFPMYVKDEAYRYDENKVSKFLDQLLLDERNLKALDTATLYGHLKGSDYQKAWKFVRERLDSTKSK